jgi:nicotinate dehydrogenase medium molybdopterin subunit
LQCPLADIRVVGGDTDCCPDSGTMAGSRVTYVIGRSVQMAAEKLMEQLQGIAASMMDVDPQDLRFGEGAFRSPGAKRQTVSVAQAVRRLKEEGAAPVGEADFYPEITALDPKTGQGAPMATYAFATQGALVSLDMESGDLEVLTIVACHDVGRAVNPANVIGQIEGAVSMGLGFTLMEEVLLQDGMIRNPRFSEYLIPTSLDMPETVSYLVEAPEASGPFGAKGIGEPALIPTAPAILNAIHAAAGIRVKDLPATPEALWKLLSSLPEKKVDHAPGKR